MKDRLYLKKGLGQHLSNKVKEMKIGVSCFVGLIVIILTPLTAQAVKRPMSDAQIREVIVKGSVNSFTGDCPCPYSTDPKGNKCGDNSEYFQSPGDLYCYPEDVSNRQIFEFRARNRIPNPKQPWEIFRSND